MMGAHGRNELFYYRPINYDRYSRVHAQDFEPLMTQRNCLTPGRVSSHDILFCLLSPVGIGVWKPSALGVELGANGICRKLNAL